jgi:hypothetical protein
MAIYFDTVKLKNVHLPTKLFQIGDKVRLPRSPGDHICVVRERLRNGRCFVQWPHGQGFWVGHDDMVPA